MGCSVVLTPREHLLLGRAEDERVLVLRCEGPLDVDEGRVRLDEANVAQVFEPKEVLLAPQTVQKPVC